MNDILNKFLDQQTPEQMAKDFAEIKKRQGTIVNDITVEEALGITFEPIITFQPVIIKGGFTITKVIKKPATTPFYNKGKNLYCLAA